MTTATKTKKETKKTAPAAKKAPAKKASTSTKKDDAFSVFETGGKQYKVSVGDVVNVEKLPEAEEGKKVSFDKVLLTDDGKETKIGDPYLKGSKVDAEVVKIGRAKKITVVKYKAKSRYHKKRGHRQPFVQIKISKI